MDEHVDIIDEKGNVTHSALKSDAHAQGLLHATVIAYVKSGDSWTFVRQTPDRQDAGQLVAPVGGHVKTGETEFEALVRETQEEIGVQDFAHTLLGKARFHRHILGRDENHLFVVFEIIPRGIIALGDEADAVEHFTTQELRQALHASPDRFGEALFFAFEHFYPHVLPANRQKRWT